MAVVNFKQKPGNTSELAYKYLRRGIALIQLMPGTKKPRGSNWQEDVFTNPEDATYFTKYNIRQIIKNQEKIKNLYKEVQKKYMKKKPTTAPLI